MGGSLCMAGGKGVAIVINWDKLGYKKNWRDESSTRSIIFSKIYKWIVTLF